MVYFTILGLIQILHFQLKSQKINILIKTNHNWLKFFIIARANKFDLSFLALFFLNKAKFLFFDFANFFLDFLLSLLLLLPLLLFFLLSILTPQLIPNILLLDNLILSIKVGRIVILLKLKINYQ